MRFGRLFAVAAAIAAMATSACRPNPDPAQLVNKGPAKVYNAFADAFSESAMGGASQYSNLWHGGMQIFVEKTSDTKLDVITKFDQQTASEAHFMFTPQNDGNATLVEAKVSVDRDVMRKALAGTPRQQLADIPDVAYVEGMQRLMKLYAGRIEAGIAPNDPKQGWITAGTEPPPEFYAEMPEEMRATIRRHQEEQRQERAAAPMIDPDADAQRFLQQ